MNLVANFFSCFVILNGAATSEVKKLVIFQILHSAGGSPVQNEKMQLKLFRTCFKGL
jgi:hypothetical protein